MAIKYKFPIAACILEVIVIVLFGIFVRYNSLADPTATLEVSAKATAANSKSYAVYQDINVMMFVGFAFLMVFLRKGAFTSVGYTFFVTAYVIQVSILWRGFFHGLFKRHFQMLELGYNELINGLYASGSILISLGAYLGKATIFQFLIISSLEVIFYSINETLIYATLEVADVGGSIVIHTFGAYFGIAVSFFLSNAATFKKSEHNNSSNKQSDTFALLGTVFLWMFWPSFNCAIPENGSQVMRTVINTIASLSGSCIATFIASSFLHKGKINIIDIQNATLAGGVSIGAVADLNIGIYGSLIIGNIAGWISALGYKYSQPKIKRIDTCGVNNLHGMTGVFGGICSMFAAFFVKSYETHQLHSIYPAIESRGYLVQGGIQFASLVICLAIAIGSGALTGLIAKRIDSIEEFFKDDTTWEEEEVEDDELSSVVSSKISLPPTPKNPPSERLAL